MGSLVLGLSGINASMLPRVGGKAANLGELLSAGLPAPEGFCLTTEAYRQATVPLGLEDVHRALHATAANDLVTLFRLAGRARGLITAADLPAGIAGEVQAAYAGLGGADRPDVP